MILEMKSSSQFHIVVVRYMLMSFLFFLFNGASGTTFTIVNDCNFTVWPGISTPDTFNITGFELTKGTSRSFEAPTYWEATIWGRTGCTFNGSGHGSCATGDCGTNEMECNGGTATPSATLVEVSSSYQVIGPLDVYSYRVNMTTGYNLPILMEATGNEIPDWSDPCPKVGCLGDFKKWCPTELILAGGGGCNSTCQASDDYPNDCCPYGICNTDEYDKLYQSACPKSESSCPGANYTVTFCPPTDAFSTIKPGRQLRSTDQLLSIPGDFTLGFFGDGNRYLGIWYTDDVESRKVWVANPNSPIISPSGIHALSIDSNTGNLIIDGRGKTLMRITNIQVGPNPNLAATLRYDGNFLLINEMDKSILWQSFDHPTNVLLPGMKLGSNIKTGRNWTLTSWLSNEIPDSGAFTLSWEAIDESSQRLMIRRRGKPYWTSGYRYNNYTILNMFALNGPPIQSQYHLSFVYNNEERYLVYEDSNPYNSFPMWILTPKGQIIDSYNSTWNPEFCYGYDLGDGCVESGLPRCRREGDAFSERKGELAPDMTKREIVDDPSLSISDCFIKCWNDCQCVGFYNSTTNGTGCVIWTGINRLLVNQQDNSPLKYVINYQNPSTGNKHKNMNWIWILIGVAIPLLFLCLWLLWYIKKRKQDNERRKRDEYFLELTASESFKDVHQLEGNGGNGNELLLFSLTSIMAATDDFSVENKLGQGGFGPVYKWLHAS